MRIGVKPRRTSTSPINWRWRSRDDQLTANACPDLDAIRATLDPAAAPSARDGLISHLVACPNCMTLVDEMDGGATIVEQAKRAGVKPATPSLRSTQDHVPGAGPSLGPILPFD